MNQFGFDEGGGLESPTTTAAVRGDAVEVLIDAPLCSLSLL